MSILSIEIDPEQQRQIENLASDEGVSVKELILERTLHSVPDQERDTTEILLSHPKNRQRLMDSINAPEAESLFFNTVDELRDALGIKKESV